MNYRVAVWIAVVGVILIGMAPMFAFAQEQAVTPPSKTDEPEQGTPPQDTPADEQQSTTPDQGPAPPHPVIAGTPTDPDQPYPMWGAIEPGKGFLVARTDYGSLYISTYILVRYLNQLPPDETFVDHLGVTHNVKTRNDIYSHRILVFLKGWIGLPKLQYQVIFWTVNTTDQKAIFGVLGYQLSKKFSFYAGLNALPGTRSLQGSHPYWLGHDRVMADEFFRPYFTNGAWVNGELAPGFFYSAMVGNNLSALGITATQLTRDLATAGSVWWMPTTKEFGPQGGYGDWEYHEKLATRFGVSTTRSREDGFSDSTFNSPDNTTIRMADSLNLFEPNSLAIGVRVDKANYRMLAADAGMKYHGVFLQTEFYKRWLSNFVADGPLPFTEVVDKGFYVQAAFYPIRKKLETYALTSQIFGDKSAGYGKSNEYTAGVNYYMTDSRNYRVNLQVIRVNHSPVSSTFGYYTGGQKGWTVALGASIFY